MRAVVIRASVALLVGAFTIGGSLSEGDAWRPAPPAGAPAMARGPQQSTMAVRWIIRSQYRRDREVDDRRVIVRAERGLVTLHGVVPSEEARARAVSIAEQVRGVSQVSDRLQVYPDHRGDRASGGRPRGDQNR